VRLASSLTLLAVWWLLLSPVAVGGKASFVIVLGRSMEPQYSAGDLVIARAASEYRMDDVVIFRSSGQRGYVIHRIVGGDEARGWTTRGDGNAREDRWVVPDEAIIGRELLVIPRAARVVTSVQESPFRFAALVGTLVTVLMMLAPSEQESGARREVGRGRTEPPGSVGPDVDPVALDEMARVHAARVTRAEPSSPSFDEIAARLDALVRALRAPEERPGVADVPQSPATMKRQVPSSSKPARQPR
jgi:signal peptidase I